MTHVVRIVVVLVLTGTTAMAQQRAVTINRHDSFSYRNKTAKNLGYATMGLTAFLALLDSGTGARQQGVPMPGYPNVSWPWSWRRLGRRRDRHAAHGPRWHGDPLQRELVHVAVTAGARPRRRRLRGRVSSRSAVGA